jgi:hypothetical protein
MEVLPQPAVVEAAEVAAVGCPISSGRRPVVALVMGTAMSGQEVAAVAQELAPTQGLHLVPHPPRKRVAAVTLAAQEAMEAFLRAVALSETVRASALAASTSFGEEEDNHAIYSDGQ